MLRDIVLRAFFGTGLALAALSLAHAADAPAGTGTSQLGATSVTIPDLAFEPTPQDVRNYGDYNYYSKPGVSFDAALADIRECKSYSTLVTPTYFPPAFVPIGRPVDAEHQQQEYENKVFANSFGMYGLVGVGIGAIVISNLQDDIVSDNTRRCMHYRGYLRYGTSNSIWHQLHKGTDQEVETKLARAASTPNAQGTAIQP